MTFPQRLHEVIQDPKIEAKVLDMITAECLKEYADWREPDGVAKDGYGIGGLAASANLLCRFVGVLEKDEHENQRTGTNQTKDGCQPELD